MSKNLLFGLFVCLVLSVSASQPQEQKHFNIVEDVDFSQTSSYSVLFDEESGAYKIVDGIQEEGSAFAVYQGDQSITGWAYLSVNTSSNYNDSVQAHSAGYVEGYLTYEMIYNQRYNYLMNTFNTSAGAPDALVNWIYSNIDFMKSSIENATAPEANNQTLSQYWQTVSLTLSQIRGLLDGYNDGRLTSSNPEIAATELQVHDIFILNMYGDLFELIPALGLGMYNLSTQAQVDDYLHKSGHCTSMVKMTDDLSEIYAAHTTFDFYYMAIRIFKAYYFSYSAESGIQTRDIMFSSYPGVIVSIDDFYQMDSGLVVLETTNSLITQDLYHLIKPESVLYWVRISAANKMSTTPLQWCQTFSQFNSGTYNNQYVVLDYKRFVPYFGIQEGGLYVLEQTIGFVEYADQTYTLRTGYFPGYNIPYYYSVFNISGYNTISNDTLNTYQGAARGQIFRRSANDIKSLEDAKDFMRYNDWEKDPLSYGSPWNQICARGDLGPDPSAGGCLDTKLTSYELYKKKTVIAISGPTTSHNLPPFDWNSRDWNTTHVGLIDYWNYEWVTFTNSTYFSFK